MDTTGVGEGNSSRRKKVVWMEVLRKKEKERKQTNGLLEKREEMKLSYKNKTH